MRRAVKVKNSAAHVPLRKAVLTASAASRRAFPAWISADEPAIAFPARAAMPRVRSALVLRTVSKKKPAKLKSTHDAAGAR